MSTSTDIFHVEGCQVVVATLLHILVVSINEDSLHSGNPCTFSYGSRGHIRILMGDQGCR